MVEIRDRAMCGEEKILVLTGHGIRISQLRLASRKIKMFKGMRHSKG